LRYLFNGTLYNKNNECAVPLLSIKKYLQLLEKQLHYNYSKNGNLKKELKNEYFNKTNWHQILQKEKN
jgi:hypothetical protein